MAAINNADLHDGLDCGDPIRNLWAAVIRNALIDLRGRTSYGYGGSIQAAQISALHFFCSEDSMLPFICENIGIDISAVRSRAEKIISGARRKWN